MITAISELQKTHSRMTTILNELENLEDGEDIDYTGILFTYKKILYKLENRRESLQKRGRTQ